MLQKVIFSEPFLFRIRKSLQAQYLFVLYMNMYMYVRVKNHLRGVTLVSHLFSGQDQTSIGQILCKLHREYT